MHGRPAGKNGLHPVPTGIILKSMLNCSVTFSSPRTYGDYPLSYKDLVAIIELHPCLRGLSRMTRRKNGQRILHPVSTGIIRKDSYVKHSPVKVTLYLPPNISRKILNHQEQNILRVGVKICFGQKRKSRKWRHRLEYKNKVFTGMPLKS